MDMKIASWLSRTYQENGMTVEVYTYTFENPIKQRGWLGEFRQFFKTDEYGTCRPEKSEIHNNRGLIGTFTESARLSDDAIKMLLCL